MQQLQATYLQVITDNTPDAFIHEEFGDGDDSEDSDYGEGAMSSDLGEPEDMDEEWDEGGEKEEIWFEGGSASGSSRSRESKKSN